MPQQPSWTNKEIGLLNTVLVLAQWEKNLPRYIAKLFGDAEQYAAALVKIREGLAQAEPERVPPLPAPGRTLTSGEWESLYVSIARAAPLRDLFKSKIDPFSGFTPDQMLVMAGLSDVGTDPHTMFYTRDEAFMAVLAAMRQPSPPDTNRFIKEGLERFLYLAEAGGKVVEMLNDLARSSDWQIVLASLRDRRTYTEEGSSAATTLAQWNENLTPDLRTRIFSPNYVSRVPPELVRLACDGRSLFTEAGQNIPQQVNDSTARREHLAAAAFTLFERDYSERLNTVKSNLQLRFDVAKHLTDVRRFAKMDAFVHSWPKVASLARARYKSWEYVEDCFTRHRPRPSDADLEANGARELYELCAADPQLTSFLDLRPQFGEIDENLFIGYKPIASVSLETPASPPPAPATTSAAGKGPTIVPTSSLNTVIVRIETVGPDLHPSSHYPVKLSVRGQDGNPIELAGEVQIDVSKLLQEMMKIIGSSSPENLRAFLKDFSSRAGDESKVLLARAGMLLFETVFTPSMRNAFTQSLEGDQKVRVVIQSEANELIYLPWEWLPGPSQIEPLVRLPKFSLIRASSNSERTSLSPLRLPLPVVVMMMPDQSVDFERSVATLERVFPSGKAQAIFLVNLRATLTYLRETLNSLKPQIAHFEGHLTFLSEDDDSALKDFAGELLTNGVKLVVFGNNRMGAFYGNPNAKVAAALVQHGLPAVLAATRPVDDVTAINFMTEFYQSFLEGASLEQATNDARAKSSRRGGDWSAFALFANPSVLDFFSALAPAS